MYIFIRQVALLA